MPGPIDANLFRPAIPGCAVATPGRGSGTLGCVVRDPTPGGATYVLSAAHVIGNHTFDPLDLPVLQPGTVVGAAQVIGKVARWGALRFTADTFPNLFDAAIARVDPIVVVPDIFSLGRPLGVRDAVPNGTPVRKCGATTDVTRGVVVRSDYFCAFFYTDPQGARHRAGFQQQILCRAPGGTTGSFSERGDSGAAVLDAENRVIGLVVGATDDGTVVCPISPVLQSLKVALA
jgi:hypothetical protein